MNIYTLESVTKDYYEFTDVKSVSVSLQVVIDEMKALVEDESICDYHTISVHDGFTGKLLRSAHVSWHDAPATTIESLYFVDAK